MFDWLLDFVRRDHINRSLERYGVPKWQSYTQLCTSTSSYVDRFTKYVLQADCGDKMDVAPTDDDGNKLLSNVESTANDSTETLSNIEPIESISKEDANEMPVDQINKLETDNIEDNWYFITATSSSSESNVEMTGSWEMVNDGNEASGEESPDELTLIWPDCMRKAQFLRRIEKMRRASGADTKNTLDYNERVPDDFINTYCDRLQEAMEVKVDGMLAIQFITQAPEFVSALITGTRNVLQVILDHERAHFVLLVYVTSRPYVCVYDPLLLNDNPSRAEIEQLLSPSIRKQMFTLFAHMFEGETIPVAVTCGIEMQSDNWSCGLRAIANLTLLVCGQSVEAMDLDLDGIRRFLLHIVHREDKPSFEDFCNAKLGSLRSTPRRRKMLTVTMDKETLQL